MSWDLGELPFHVGAQPRPSNGELPDALPFSLDRDAETGALVQAPNPEVSVALERAYGAGSQIGTPLEAEGAGRAALEDFAGFLREACDGGLEGRSVLEIGSGRGGLLALLAEAGAEVTGVEPGAEPQADSLPVIAEQFSAALFDRRFELIVHYAVLEHIEDPRAFLAEQISLLEPGGRLVFSVPDCREAIARGDLSILLHEHWSYFDPESLAALAASASAGAVEIRESGPAAGALYCAWTPSEPGAAALPSAASEGFAERARAGIKRVRSFLAEARGPTLGVYAPARFINYQQLLAADCPPIRYFDDDPALEGRYYPPFEIAVQTRNSLRAQPPERVLVMSWTFGEALAAELRSDPALDGVEVETIAGLLAY